MALGDIITLCGTSLYKPGWEHAAATLERAGYAVFSIHIFGHADGIQHPAHEKALLDAVHLKKIEASTAVVVITDPNGYVGESTAREVFWASSRGVPVQYWVYDPDEHFDFLGRADSLEDVTAGNYQVDAAPDADPNENADAPGDVQTAVGPEAVDEVVDEAPNALLREDG